jgi:hypothetical protein
MTNLVSSFPAARHPAPLHGYGGTLEAMSELGISHGADSYTVEGNGIIRSLPTVAYGGVPITLKMKGAPTFVNSSNLICPNGRDYQARSGDLVKARSDGDGVWRLYVLEGNGPRPGYGIYNVEDYGAKGNGRVISSCSITSGAAALTNASAAFTSADVGKRIAVGGAGASGVDLVTSITVFVSPTQVTLAANAGTTLTATGYVMLGTDNTAAIHAARDAAKVAGGIVHFGAGTFVCGPLAFNSCVSVHIEGIGKQSGAGPTNYGSHIWPLVAPSAALPCLDWTGSTHCTIRGVQIGRSDLLGRPIVGVFSAAKGGTESTHLDIRDTFIIGTFTYAALYQYGVPDCSYQRCQFYNYLNDGSASAVTLTGTNARGVTSSVETVNTGLIDTSNCKFTDCHIIEQGNTVARSLPVAMLLDCISLLRMTSCNFISQNALVAIADFSSSSPAEEIVIENSVLAGSFPPAYGVRVDTTSTIRGITLRNNVYNNDGAAGTGGPDAIVGINPGCRVDGLTIKGVPSASGGSLITATTTPVTGLRGVGWDVDGGSMPISLHGTIQGRVRTRGTITIPSGATLASEGRLVKKAGSAGGTYTTSSTSATNVDGTNLAASVYVPVGMQLRVYADCAVGNTTAGQSTVVQITDTTAGASLDTRDVTSPSGGQIIPLSLCGIINGDDTAHSFSLQWLVGANGGIMRNSSAADAPKLLYEFMSQ